MHDWVRRLENTDFRSGSVNDAGTTSLNIPSSPVPLSLGLHALPLGSLDRAHPQAEPTSPFETRVAQHTFNMPRQREQRNIN